MTLVAAGARIVVTGSAGLIGRPTAELLREEGADVVAFDRVASGIAGTTERVGDLRDTGAVHAAMDGADAVVHLGGIPGPELVDDVTTYAVNAVGTYAVFSAAAAAGAQKVVYASSINASGLPIGKRQPPSGLPYDEDDVVSIADSYSLSKQANEAAAQMAATRWGLSLTGLRFPLVRDLRSDRGVAFAAHIRAALAADPRRQAYEGWSYLDVGDAARAALHALTHETPPVPGILVAAPSTYLRESTAEAAARVVPGLPVTSTGRSVGLALARSRELLGFTATTLLEEFGEHLLATTEETS